MRTIIMCLLAMLGLATACGQKNYEDADVQGFSDLIAKPNVVVLDVRTAAEFEEEHIAGAINIDQGQDGFMERAKAALPADKTIAIYCRSGRRSANAANRLAAAGFKCVNLKGGIVAWKEAGKMGLKKVYNEDINPLEQINQAIFKIRPSLKRDRATARTRCCAFSRIGFPRP